MSRNRNPVLWAFVGLMGLTLLWASWNTARGRSAFGSAGYVRTKPTPGYRPLHHK